MSTGLRDQRIRVFGYNSTGSDGWASSEFPYVGEYWGRLEPAGGREATIAAQAQQKVDAVAVFDINVEVQRDGILKGPDGKIYKVTAVLPRRMAKEQEVFCEYGDDATYSLTGEP